MRYISIAELTSVREIQLVFSCGAGIRCYNHYCNNYNELKQLQQFVKYKIQNSKQRYVVEWYKKLDNQLNKINMQYICYIWKYNHNNTAVLSRDNESLEDFKKRVKEIYPYSEDYHHRFSEFKEIY